MNAPELQIFAFACATLPKLLYPFAPHIAEELWQKMGNKNMLNDCGLPEYEERYLILDKITYVIQVNGKLRGKIEVEPDITAEEIKRMALKLKC